MPQNWSRVQLFNALFSTLSFLNKSKLHLSWCSAFVWQIVFELCMGLLMIVSISSTQKAAVDYYLGDWHHISSSTITRLLRSSTSVIGWLSLHSFIKFTNTSHCKRKRPNIVDVEANPAINTGLLKRLGYASKQSKSIHSQVHLHGHLTQRQARLWENSWQLSLFVAAFTWTGEQSWTALCAVSS